MCYAKPGDWMDKDSAQALTAWLQANVKSAASSDTQLADGITDAIAGEASVLAALGENGAPAIPALEEAMKLTDAGRLPGALVVYCGLALARLDPAGQEQALRKVAGHVGNPAHGDHTLSAAILVMANRIDAPMLSRVLRLLDDADPQVVAGAATLLAAKGLSARDAVPRLVELAKSSADAHAASTAAAALGVVAPLSDLPKVQGIIGHAKSPDAEESAAQSVAIISLREDRIAGPVFDRPYVPRAGQGTHSQLPSPVDNRPLVW